MIVSKGAWNRMDNERKLNLIYFVLGFATGIASNYLNGWIPLGLAVATYLISFALIKRNILEKKKLSWYISNTLFTFLLVWIVTWIFVYNL